MPFNEILALGIAAVTLFGIARGKLPFIGLDRPSIAFCGAALMIVTGAIGLEEALAAVDLKTLVLLLSMMIVSAYLKLSGFFGLASSRLLAVARTTRQLLALLVAVAGLFSALFVNDTMCVILAPLVVIMCRSAGRGPLPYLIAVAVASNIGSAATIIGNPQNMLIGAASGIPFGEFALRLALPAAAGLVLAWIAVAAAHPAEFRAGTRVRATAGAGERAHGRLLRLCGGVVALMLAALLAGVPVVAAAIGAAALLLALGGVKPAKAFRHVDWGLLVLFAGLFIVIAALGRTAAFRTLAEWAAPAMRGGPWPLASAAVVLSNLVSNVPAVMLLGPMVAGLADPRGAWTMLALSSTFAGNLTLLGSVANLIVAEGARKAGVTMGFRPYLRVGLPLTLVSCALGVALLSLFPR